MSGVSRGMSRGETQAGSSAGRHVGGQDVVRVAVEVVAGSVISHRGAGIGVTGGDREKLVRLAVTFAELGCPYQQARTGRIAAGPLARHQSP